MGAIKKLVFAGGLVLLSSLSMAAPVAVDPGSTFVLKMVKPIELNASVGSVTSAPTTCSSRTIMWSGSASCSASVPAMSNGSTRTLNDTTGKIGSATVSCNAASNAITVSGGSSCTDPVAVGNRPCSAQAVNWGACTASAPARNHGQNSSISDSTAPSTGSATFTCNDSSFVYSSGNCSTAATTCTNKAVNWSVAGNACSALSGVTNDGANKTVSNTASNGNTGNATFTCTASSDTYSLVGSPTCAPPPATACTSQTLGWNVGGTSCSSNSGSVNNGVTTTLASTNGNSGSAQFTCNASTNTFSQTGTPTCAVPPPSSCTSQSKTWGTAPSDCAALTGTTTNGASRTISNTASNGNSGSATYVCNAGTNTYTVSGTPTCSQPAPSACTSQTKSWGTAPANCSAVTGATNNSVSKTVANTLNANSGSATYVCNAATDTYTVSGTPTCSQPAPTSCTSQTKTWGTAPANCSAATGATSNSVSKTISNTLNANNGSATFVCNASTDTYTVSGTPVCNQPIKKCSNKEVVWSRKGTCRAFTGTPDSGQTVFVEAVKNSGNKWMIGNARFLCNGDSDTYTQVDTDDIFCGERNHVVSRNIVSTSAEGDVFASGLCAVYSDQKIRCWGLGAGYKSETNEQLLGIGYAIVPYRDKMDFVDRVVMSAADARSTCIVNTSGGVKCRGKVYWNSTELIDFTSASGLESGVKKIAMAEETICSIKNDNNLYCMGNGLRGQLGNRSTDDASTAVRATVITEPVLDVAVGHGYTCVVLSGGKVKCWGEGRNGQLGNNTFSSSLEAVDVVGLSSGASKIFAAGGNTCVIMTTGAVKCWGVCNMSSCGTGVNGNQSRPVDVASLPSGVLKVSISRDGNEACSLMSDGKVKCWGEGSVVNYTGSRSSDANGRARADPIIGLSGTAVDISNNFGSVMCAVIDDGTAQCWGDDGGQGGINYGTDRRSQVNVGQVMTPVYQGD